MKRLTRIPIVLAATVVAVTAASVPEAAAAPFGYANLNKIQQRHVSGLLSANLNGDDAAGKARTLAPSAMHRATAAACANRFGDNIKVNQNCLNITDPDLQGRAQAQNETWVSADPGNGAHLVASYNDYRRGDGTCGVSYSLDGGRSWADSTVPNGFGRGDAFAGGKPREYWQGGGDTSTAWDTKGNVYLSCQLFNRGNGTSPNPDQSSAFYVFRSTGSNGASFNFTGRPAVQHDDTAGAGDFLLDKQLLTVDNHRGSRFADRVYMTWTTFAADGTGYIYSAHSADYGETFSAPVLVSTTSPLCDNTLGLPTPSGTCNQNQDSQPFTAPDGTLYVVFNNFNKAVSGADNRSQVLLARSTDGGASFSAPVRVGFYYELPDCATYQNGQDPGRACIPEKGPSFNSVFRASQYPIGAVDPTHPNRVVVTYGSYINRDSNELTGCTPAGIEPSTAGNLYTGVKNGTCNNDILLSTSNNSGASFTGTTTDPRALPVVTTAPGQARTDQYWQGAAFAPDGTLAVSYYDRQYGADNNIGFSDITLSTATGAAFRHTRVTSGSMPPPTQFNGTFFGDYAGIGVTATTAYPIWSDTRPVDQFLCPGTGTPGTPPAICEGGAPNASIANDEDIYIKGVALK
ncbi:exo-alpha-sialidase [Actinocrispum sp. NPDC049592]|uniref:exo-alpha-sialidase n=1 Tax=Actinocrispum sp. NPDC049592 TaxID=3154835 RepID=UPI00344A809E